jgi:hypothetical protein
MYNDAPHRTHDCCYTKWEFQQQFRQSSNVRDCVIGYNDVYSIHLFIATSTDGPSFEGVIITENDAINSLYRMSIV